MISNCCHSQVIQYVNCLSNALKVMEDFAYNQVQSLSFKIAYLMECSDHLNHRSSLDLFQSVYCLISCVLQCWVKQIDCFDCAFSNHHLADLITSLQFILQICLVHWITQVFVNFVHVLLFQCCQDFMFSHLDPGYRHLVNLITFEWPNQQIH